MSDSVIPWTVAHQASLSMGILQASILEWAAMPSSRGSSQPREDLGPNLLHCRWLLYHLSHQGSPRISKWVAYAFSRRSSQLRNQTRVSCIAGKFFTSWATREALLWGAPNLRLGMRWPVTGDNPQTSSPYHHQLINISAGQRTILGGLVSFKVSTWWTKITKLRCWNESLCFPLSTA